MRCVRCKQDSQGEDLICNRCFEEVERLRRQNSDLISKGTLLFYRKLFIGLLIFCIFFVVSSLMYVGYRDRAEITSYLNLASFLFIVGSSLAVFRLGTMIWGLFATDICRMPEKKCTKKKGSPNFKMETFKVLLAGCFLPILLYFILAASWNAVLRHDLLRLPQEGYNRIALLCNVLHGQLYILPLFLVFFRCSKWFRSLPV